MPTKRSRQASDGDQGRPRINRRRVRSAASSKRETPPPVVLPPLPKQDKTPRILREGLAPDTKLDLLGIALIVLSLLTVFGLISSSEGELTRAWLTLLRTLFGWWMLAVPVAMGIVGVWLLMRHFDDKPPQVTNLRLMGAALGYADALAITHFLGMLLSPGADPIAAGYNGEGGGIVGAYAADFLIRSVGVPGSALVLIGVALVAMVLITGTTLRQMLAFVSGFVRTIRSMPKSGQELAQPTQDGIEPVEQVKRPSSPGTPREVDAKGDAEGDGKAKLLDAARDAAQALSGDGAPVQEKQGAGKRSKRRTTPNGSREPATGVTEDRPYEIRIVPDARDWSLPDYHQLLDESDDQRIDDKVLLERAKIIEETLRSFGAPGRVVEINPGPVITQFGVEPDYVVTRSGKRTRVKVSKIAALADDLALALAAKSIRIEAPVPGKGYVGVEVPNAKAALVGLRDIMDSEEFEVIDSNLRICLGESVDGTPVVADLAAMPHLLIAGTTGSGKSVCINAIISCLLLQNTPDDLRFIMIDPKRVELTGYNGIPHLVAPVVVELERIVGVLKWVSREMDDRYRRFSSAGARNINDFNSRKLPKDAQKMPYLVVVIDELADLMMLAPDETERLITRLAQMARATGIHLVISTQRPSVDIITGLIKANFPARIAFAVASGVDSRVILDMPGAERLLGRGDMLFQAPDASAPVRLQGVFVSDVEIERIVRYWKEAKGVVVTDPAPPPRKVAIQNPNSHPTPRTPRRKVAGAEVWDGSEGARKARRNSRASNDDLYDEAVKLVRRLQKASISLLQRHLRIGYTRAARLIDMMEERGVIGPATGSSAPREVYPSPEDGEHPKTTVSSPKES